MRRSGTAFAVVLSFGLGVYLGATQLAGSAPTRPRVITLRSQDVAVFGGVQCLANTEAGRRHFLCSRRPRTRSRYDTAVFPSSVAIYRMGRPDDPLFVTP